MVEDRRVGNSGPFAVLDFGVLVRIAQDGSIGRLELLGSYGRPQPAFSTFCFEFTLQLRRLRQTLIQQEGVHSLFLHFM